MRSGRDQHGVAHTHQTRHGVVRMRGEDDVEAFHTARQLAIDIEAVVREQHDDLRALGARLVDLLLHVFFADSEFPFREHPARVGNCGARQRLSDHGNLRAAFLEHFAWLEHRLLPFVVAHVLRKEGERRLVGDFLDAIRAIGEFPVTDHGVDLKGRHDVDHVLRLGLQRSPTSLPGVAAIEQQHFVLAALGAHCIDQRGGAVHAAHAAVVARERYEIIRSQCISIGRTRGDVEILPELRVSEMRRQAFVRADAEIDRRLAEIQRHQLRMIVRDIKDGHRAERIELEDVRLRQLLLRGDAPERTKSAADRERRRSRARLQEFPPRYHQTTFVPSGRETIFRKLAPARHNAVRKNQLTVSLFLAVYSEPSSSFQVKVNSPVSDAL